MDINFGGVVEKIVTRKEFPLTDAATLACAASAVTIKKLKTTGTATRAEIEAVQRT